MVIFCGIMGDRKCIVTMRRFRQNRRNAQGMAREGRALIFRNPISGRLRLLIGGWFSFLCGAFIAIFITQWQKIDWLTRPHWYELGVGFFFFLLLPLSIWIGALWYALFARSTELRLDPDSKKAVLRRKGLWGARVARYPLGSVDIVQVTLMAENPAYEEPKVVLRMPDGVKVELTYFAEDGQAKDSVAQIRQIISGHSSPPAT